MFQVKTPALVLDKQAGYNDEGKITLLTRDYGILRLTASGVFRQGASLAIWTEPPASLVADISLQEKSPGYGRLFTLSPKNFFAYLRADHQNLSWFYFYCFLLLNFIPQGSRSAKAFDLLKEILEFQKSWESDEGRDLNFVYFLVKLLKTEGICSGFNYCLSCEEQFAEDETVYFTLGKEGLLCEKCSKRIALSNNGYSNGFSLDFLSFVPIEKRLALPAGILRVRPEERTVLAVCEKSEYFKGAYTNIFSRPKINDQTLAKVRNFLLIFLAPLL